jgi:bifunctional non-homologous end joining protein LigD
VQRHDARRLHYDFRLERDGVLASWAVPKESRSSRASSISRFHVEDHPLEYGSFEGEIPKGTTARAPSRSGIAARTSCSRRSATAVSRFGCTGSLEGTWALVPAHLSGDEKNWLILRKREDGRRSVARARYAPMLATLTESCRGRRMAFEPKWDGYRALATSAAARRSSSRAEATT